MRKKRLFIIALAVSMYIGLLWLLTYFESADPNASIQNIWDALWFSFVTLSTVGYGDTYPVTAEGRVLGILFVLLSTGLLVFLVGTIVSLLTGRMLPMLQLWQQRKKQWYVFSQCNDSTLALARDFASSEPACCLLFPQEAKRSLPEDLPCFCYPGTISQAVSGKKEKCSLFFMSDPSGVNYALALEHLGLGHPVYCRTEQAPDLLPENLTVFNRYACCAREYWHNRPIHSAEKTVVLIGDGKYAQRLLETGLLMNVFEQGRTLHYHVFGDWQNFRRNHSHLNLTVSVNREDSAQDCLFFCEGAWNADEALLLGADRIILCNDDERDNLTIFRQLSRYFATSGAVHLRADVDIPGALTFGTDRMIYTRKLVMRTQLTGAAQTIHRIYQESTNRTAPPWEQLSEFSRQANICAADHLLVKIRLLLKDETITDLTQENCASAYQVYSQTKTTCADTYRRMEHRRWMRFHSMYNWQYDPVRDDRLRRHPMLRPFDELPPSEQDKNDYAWEILANLAENY